MEGLLYFFCTIYLYVSHPLYELANSNMSSSKYVLEVLANEFGVTQLFKIGKIVILVHQLSFDIQFRPLTVLVLKLYVWVQFRTKTIKVIISVLKVCILGSTSYMNYQLSDIWA
jgi:hypothetical protein